MYINTFYNLTCSQTHSVVAEEAEWTNTLLYNTIATKTAEIEVVNAVIIGARTGNYCHNRSFYPVFVIDSLSTSIPPPPLQLPRARVSMGVVWSHPRDMSCILGSSSVCVFDQLFLDMGGGVNCRLRGLKIDYNFHAWG